jgi:hypothetical protein
MTQDNPAELVRDLYKAALCGNCARQSNPSNECDNCLGDLHSRVENFLASMTQDNTEQRENALAAKCVMKVPERYPYRSIHRCEHYAIEIINGRGFCKRHADIVRINKELFK